MMGAFSVLFGTNDTVLALLPLVPPLIFAIPLLFANPTTTTESSSVCRSILAYFGVAVAGFIVTNSLIPNIKQYTLRKGISGKDLGKRGTSIADKDMYVDVNHSNFQILVDTFGLQRDTSKKDPKTTMPCCDCFLHLAFVLSLTLSICYSLSHSSYRPEALGIVPGAVFLVCLIFCLVGYATSQDSKLLDVNSALLSICFMLFLGFTDDVLDWPWRYKLVLPSVASLPLLCCYNGSTSVVVPIQLRKLLWKTTAINDDATLFGHILGHFLIIDSEAKGAIVELGYLYLIYMGMLAVFCTNAINILAGINGKHLLHYRSSF